MVKLNTSCGNLKAFRIGQSISHLIKREMFSIWVYIFSLGWLYKQIGEIPICLGLNIYTIITILTSLEKSLVTSCPRRVNAALLQRQYRKSWQIRVIDDCCMTVVRNLQHRNTVVPSRTIVGHTQLLLYDFVSCRYLVTVVSLATNMLLWTPKKVKQSSDCRTLVARLS